MSEENYTLMPQETVLVNPAGPAGGFLPPVGLEHLKFTGAYTDNPKGQKGNDGHRPGMSSSLTF
jgi:hypothetical protein